jgi:HPt (histidine-containing phosphotransfer) domain-containing protein
VGQIPDKNQATAGSIGEDAVSLARIDRLRKSMPGKETLIDELIDLFVADLPQRLDAIGHAVERADAPALALQAHALRGGAANFGADRLDELCAKLEEMGLRCALARAPEMLDEVRRESVRMRDALLALTSQPSRSEAQGSSSDSCRGALRELPDAQKSSGSSRKL